MGINLKETIGSILKRQYTKISSIHQIFNKSEICVGDNFGRIYLIDVNSLSNSYCYAFDGHNGSRVNCIQSFDNVLLSGAYNSLKCWQFSNEQSKLHETKFEITLRGDECVASNRHLNQINDIAIMKESMSILAATGKGIIFNYDLETQKTITEFEMNKGYSVYCVRYAREFCFLSSSDDGTVTLFDVRTPLQAIKTFCPYDILSNKTGERYISCLETDNGDSILCGGGPQLALWDISSSSCISTFVMNDSQPISACISKNKICAISTNNGLYIWNYTGNQDIVIHPDDEKLHTILPYNTANQQSIIVASLQKITFYENNLIKIREFNLFDKI